MNSLHYIFLLVATAAVTLAQDGDRQVGTLEEDTSISRGIVHEVNLNKAFDNGLDRIQKYIIKNGADPMDLPDIDIAFSNLPGLLKAKMILHRGNIQQLSTVRRTGDIIMQYNDKKVTLYLNIGWKSLSLNYGYSLRYLLFTRRGDCYGYFGDVHASILIEYDIATRKIDLKFFKFVNFGDFQLRLEGNLIDGLVNLITKAVTKIFRTQILRLIESKAYEVINKKVLEINELIPDPYGAVKNMVDDDDEFMKTFFYEVDFSNN